LFNSSDQTVQPEQKSAFAVGKGKGVGKRRDVGKRAFRKFGKRSTRIVENTPPRLAFAFRGGEG
jgi:hypothetical protein